MNDIERAIAYLKDAAKIAEKNNLSQEVFEETKGIINTAISALEKQLNGGWIPASERLPTIRECQENDCRFIVTDGNRRYQVWFDYEEGYFQKCECNGLGLKKDKCVIAWQPLPSTYKEVE